MTACTVSRQRGMTLLEILVAIVVLSFGLIGLVGLQARALQISVGSEDTNRAALLANELASQMWLARTTSLPAATVQAWQEAVEDNTQAGLPNGSGDVTLNGNVATITIQWRAPSAAVGQENRYVTQVVVP